MSETNNEETKKKIGQIKQFWDEKAKTFKTDPLATLGDAVLKDIEVREVIKRIRNNDRVLDVGCGNGTSSLQIASRKTVDMTGLDYSADMIEMANQNLTQHSNPLNGTVRFEQGDILNLKYTGETFDTVITMRCLQNLPTFDLQKQAILSIKKILKPGGRLLMLECSNEGLEKLNKILRLMGREPASHPWHNLFFNDNDLNNLSRNEHFPLVEIVNVSGVYHFLASCVNYRLRRVARHLPPFLDVGYHKLYVWEKQT